IADEWIVGQLLDTQGDALTLRIDGQDNCLDLVALLVVANGFFAGLIPGDVGQMYQTVDIAIQADEDTKIGNRLDAATDLVAFLELLGEAIPGVLEALLDTQGDTTTLFIDVEDHHVDLVTQLHALGWMNILVRPVNFRDVYQTFH